MADAPPLRPLPGGGWWALEGGAAIPAEAPARPPQAGAAPPLALAPPAAPRRATGLEALHLSLGGVALAVPAALTEHIHPMPALLPLPGGPRAVRGLAMAGNAPILVLDSLLAAGGGATEEAAGLLLALAWRGRRLGLPAARIAAGPATPALRRFETWLDGEEARAALAHAPPALAAATATATATATARAEAALHVLLFRAAGLRLALPAEAVRAVLPPTTAQTLPGGGHLVAPHRGDLLPVRDAGLRLGAGRAEAGGPMIRLALTPDCLLAVGAIEGVRRIPAADITPLGGGAGLVSGLARVQGESLMLLSAGALAA